MTATEGLKALALQEFAVLEQQLAGQTDTPLHAVRTQALQAFQRLDFPTTKHEEWKYTNVRQLISRHFAYTPEQAMTAADIAPWLIPGLDAHLLVLLNGRYMPHLSSPVIQDRDLYAASLQEAAAEMPELVHAHLGRHAAFDQDAFTALSTAFARQGIFVLAKRGRVVSKPVYVLHIVDGQRQGIMAQPRHLIIAQENSQLTVFERTVFLGAQESFVNSVAEIVVEARAIADHHKLQEYPAHSYAIETTLAVQHQESRYTNNTVTLGGGLVRNNLTIRLDGRHAEAHMNGLYMLAAKDHVDNHTAVDHLQPDCQSNELYKGIADGQSTGVFNGKIFVRQDAQKTNAYQSSKAILLSDTATVDVKPQLEIWADDVKCSHGATTGALDTEPLFYLQARGISAEAARALLLRAFAAEVIEKISSEPLRQYAARALATRLGQDIED